MRPALECIDHFVYAARDLDQAVDTLERTLGVRASFGGSHPGRGTRNALLALGPASYLEILAPDPAQPRPHSPRWLGVDDVREAKLTTWAAKSTNLERMVEQAAAHRIDLGVVREGARTRADGELLTWKLTESVGLIAGGLVPFLIDWGSSPHPAQSAPHGLSLKDLRGDHPDPRGLQRMLGVLGIAMDVRAGREARLIAVIHSPRGVVEL